MLSGQQRQMPVQVQPTSNGGQGEANKGAGAVSYKRPRVYYCKLNLFLFN